MKYFYGEFDGSEFPTQDKLFGFDQLMQFILQHGEQALKAIEQMMKDPGSEQQSDLLDQLLKDGMLDKDGRLPRLNRALIADSAATSVGAALGTSTTTSYIESAAGIKAGGRTGLTAVVVGVLFLLTLFFAPLAQSVPAFATAPALLFVACMMARGLTDVDWEDVTEYAPAVVTALAMPLTFSIAHGIGFGLITYAAIKLLSGRFGDIHPAVAILAVLFVIKFAVL